MNYNNLYGQYPGTPYPAPQAPSAVGKEKEKPEYSRAELVLSVFALIAAYCFVRYVVFHATGFITTGLFMSITTAEVIYMKKKGCKFSAFNTVLTAVLYIFSIVFSITANNLIKSLDAIFLVAAGAYLIYSVGAGNKGVDRYLPFAMTKALFVNPFTGFTKQTDIAADSLSDSKTATNIKYILLGLLITFPVTMIVAGLLMAADDGVEKMLTDIVNKIFSDEMWNVLIQISIALPCSLYLFGMLYTNTHRKDIKELDENNCRQKIFRMRFISNLAVYTAVTPLCVLYVMFFISQAQYYLSAFSGNLPEGYTYADYARRGFFELFTVALINLGVLCFMSLHSKKAGREKPFALKIYSIVLSVFTIILIATAMSKMVMYIDAYGLTELRLYTSWFMVLLAMVFVMIIIKQFRFEMKFAKHLCIIFTLMFGVLCFSRPEAIIAKYNIEMYHAGQLEELDRETILRMSDDGLLAAFNEGEITEEEIESAKERLYQRDTFGKYNISAIVLDNMTE